MVTRARPVRDRLLRARDTGLWFTFVVVMAICGAGLILTFDHPQNDAGRPELTARGDAIVGPRLAALAPALAQLSAGVDAVSEQARSLYGHLRARDTNAIRADLTNGDQLAQQAKVDLAPIEAARGGLVEGTTISAISQANRTEVQAIDAAATGTEQLDGTWAGIATAAARVAGLVDSLSRHDAAVVAATSRARSSDFSGALDRLAVARTALDQASATADDAATQNLDTGTLRALIDRNRSYDAALTALYTVLAGNGGQMTADAQQAYSVVKQAQKALPDNGSAMTVIVSDLGGQQVTLGLVVLDQLRGAVAAAAPPPVPSPSPG